MKCPACQHDNEAGALFCEECGSRLVRACASCGTELKPTAKFCPKCGASTLVADIPSAQPLSRRVADYTPKHLAAKILQSKSALEGERKQVTVLFADIQGSLQLAAQLDPERWHQLLERYFAILADAVHRFEGTVNQYTGDGIMALFGAPIAHEDHKLVGCEREMASLESALEAAIAGNGQVVGVVAEARKKIAGTVLLLDATLSESLPAMVQVATDTLRRIRGTGTLGLWEPLFLAHIANAQLELGQPPLGRAAAQAGVDFMRESKSVFSPRGYAVLARAQLALNEPAAVIAGTLDEYEALLTRTCMHVCEGELHELRAQLAEREGQNPARTAALARAHECYTRFGMAAQATRVEDARGDAA